MSTDIRRLIVAEIPRLRRYARFKVHDPDLADDLVQECLLRAVAKINTWQPGTNLRAWLITILHNVTMSHFRLRKRRPTTVELLADGRELAVAGSHDRNLEMSELQHALDQLSEDHREVLLMVVVEGLRYEEVAGILGIPTGTVRSRLFRARATLKEHLNGGGSNMPGAPELVGSPDETASSAKGLGEKSSRRAISRRP
jgi:RNA polymerase sigma-70 factor (ECF subfamily)